MRRQARFGVWELIMVISILAVGYHFTSRVDSHSPQAEAKSLADSRETRAKSQPPKGKLSQEAWDKSRRLFTAAESARHSGKNEEAERLYSEALEHAHYHLLWNNRGWNRCLMGRYEGALEDAQKAISSCQEPEALKHYLHTKATALQGLERYDEAMQAVEDSLALDPVFDHSLSLQRNLIEKVEKR